MSKAHKDEIPTPSTQELVAAKVTSTYEAAREKAAAAVVGTAAGIDGKPLAALLGGLALGAAAGALLPRSDREKALLAPLGDKVADAARAAIAAGREAGKQALADSGYDVEGLRDQARKLFEGVGSTATAAGSAAIKAAREGKAA